MRTFSFKCSQCNKIHEGIPSFNLEAPLYYYAIPENERDERTSLTSETCIIDEEDFFAKGFLEIPVLGLEESLTFTPWVSLSKSNFLKFKESLGVEDAAQYGEMFGWFSSQIDIFGDCKNLKTNLILQNNNHRPNIEIEPTSHPLSIASHQGIHIKKLIEIVEYYLHKWED